MVLKLLFSNSLDMKMQYTVGERSAESVSLHASFLTFEDLIKPLNDSWVLSGLGHNYGLKRQAVRKAAVLHYNGNMKPWLEMGIRKYKPNWKRFLNLGDQILSNCNVNS